METSVPSCGWRRVIGVAVSIAADWQPTSSHKCRTQLQTPSVEHALDAGRDVPAGDGGTADIGDVIVQAQLGIGSLSRKLFSPAWAANLVPMAFAVHHHLDLLDGIRLHVLHPLDQLRKVPDFSIFRVLLSSNLAKCSGQLPPVAVGLVFVRNLPSPLQRLSHSSWCAH